MEQTDREELLIDEAMMTISEMVNGLIGPVEEIADPRENVFLEIDKIELDMPIQLEVIMSNDGRVQIGTTPPLYKIETSFMPVFHQLRFSFKKIDYHATG